MECAPAEYGQVSQAAQPTQRPCVDNPGNLEGGRVHQAVSMTNCQNNVLGAVTVAQPLSQLLFGVQAVSETIYPTVNHLVAGEGVATKKKGKGWRHGAARQGRYTQGGLLYHCVLYQGALI